MLKPDTAKLAEAIHEHCVKAHVPAGHGPEGAQASFISDGLMVFKGLDLKQIHAALDAIFAKAEAIQAMIP